MQNKNIDIMSMNMGVDSTEKLKTYECEFLNSQNGRGLAKSGMFCKHLFFKTLREYKYGALSESNF